MLASKLENSNYTQQQKRAQTAEQTFLQRLEQIRGLSLPKKTDIDEYSDPDIEEEDENDVPYSNLFELDRKNINEQTEIAKYADTIFSIARDDDSGNYINSQNVKSHYTKPIDDLRKSVVTWMVYIFQEYRMGSNTLYQAVTYFDALLSVQKIPRKDFHLAGITALWMSAKMEERSVPKLKDLASYFTETISIDCFIEYEKKILMAMDFQLTYPHAKLFLRRYIEVIDAEPAIIEASNFFAELSLWYLEFLDFHPEIIALAAICLGKLTLGEYCPVARLITYSHNQDKKQIRVCAELMIGYCKEILADPKHMLTQRYSFPELVGAIKMFKFTDNMLDCLV